MLDRTRNGKLLSMLLMFRYVANTSAVRLRIQPTQEWFDIYQPFANDDLQRFLDHLLLGKTTAGR
jgi:hypothetical protein